MIQSESRAFDNKPLLLNNTAVVDVVVSRLNNSTLTMPMLLLLLLLLLLPLPFLLLMLMLMLGTFG